MSERADQHSRTEQQNRERNGGETSAFHFDYRPASATGQASRYAANSWDSSSSPESPARQSCLLFNRILIACHFLSRTCTRATRAAAPGITVLSKRSHSRRRSFPARARRALPLLSSSEGCGPVRKRR